MEENRGRQPPGFRLVLGANFGPVLQGSGSRSLLEPGFGRCRPSGKGLQSKEGAGTDPGGGHKGPGKQRPDWKQKNQAGGGSEGSS